jgi:hypothetical protein
MNRYVSALGLALALLGFAGAAGAEDCGDFVRMPSAGQWAEWRAGAEGFKVAVLGQETRHGRAFVRWEVRTIDKGQTLISQSLTTIDAPLIVEEMILKHGSEPAMKLPPEMIKLLGGAAQSNPARVSCGANTNLVGRETVTVPAGTFAAARYYDPALGDVWLSKAAPFGLVKALSKKGEELVLVGYGANATSEITETPIETPGR